MRARTSTSRGLVQLAGWLGAILAILAMAHTLLGRPGAGDNLKDARSTARRPPLGTYLIVPGDSRFQPGARVAAEPGGRTRPSAGASAAPAARRTAALAGKTRVRRLAARSPASAPPSARKAALPGSRAASLSLQPIKALEGPDIR
jgi:hypothetical protein